MSQIVVAYWSGSGNTEMMAEAVGRGIEAAGKEAKVVSIDDIQASELENCPVFAMGCPAMGDEVIEEEIMEPFVEEVEKFVSGKKIALFGSYGWGDGEWMRAWEARMKNAGAELIAEGLIVNDAPDEEGCASCEELGKKLAEA